ncbi:hypothetical protein GGI25_002127 [Coemansia spiralis]|uniref:Alpha-galactosidase n=2 Tax=Coemansia TaxID=4863 RepID=A0A9W8G4Q5_9FUNG|nr:hypothetical protein BX070DRAFT_77414 [Coemansia spiralis]KAJ1995209.1 hypothetical protein EDC05_001047 [Coemansia umbellata]KAJ2625611.1 hypothetical protein GGI26_000411 [Coemansia sp. RSA 1358]KAJ2678742.1 hypothetical protein GGI25_002127 [Coemansia spiralis]
MISQVHVYPPLGALTSVREPTIRFRVYFVLGSSSEINADDGPGEVEIWTNMHDSAGWKGIALKPSLANHSGNINSELIFVDNTQIPTDHYIKCFELSIPSTIPSNRHFEFTVRWRRDSLTEWHWISEFGKNAHIVVYSNIPDPYQLPLNYWRRQLRSHILKIKSTTSSDYTPLPAIADSWRTSNTSASCLFRPKGEKNQNEKIPFCHLEAMERYLAFARKDKFWIIPQSGCRMLDLGNFEIVILVTELNSGVYVAMMPFSDDSTGPSSASFATSPDNILSVCVASLFSSASHEFNICVAVSASHDLQVAVKEVFHRVHLSLATRGISSGATAIANQQPTLQLTSLTKTMGYCTWNAFYHQVNSEMLVSTLKKIYMAGRASNRPLPKWVLIDDGWQCVDTYNGHGKLLDIYANKTKFPGQLEGTSAELFEIGIQRVGVWHALWGYWGGIDPNGPLALRYELERYHRRASSAVKESGDIWLISPKCIAAFYDEFYKWLRSQRVSFVKVDYQAAFETLEYYTSGASDKNNGSNLSEMYLSYYDAMENAALKYFGPGSIIYCMSQTPQIITHALCRSDNSDPNFRMVLRNSDDYFPDVPESHGWHIHCNLTNAVWSRVLESYFVADWDMFVPGKQESKIHSISRVLSGGPIYITGNTTDYMAQDLTQVAGGHSRILQCIPLLIDNNCALTDMTQVPGLLLSSTVLTSKDTVIVFACNVSSSAVVAPIDISKLCSTARQRSEQQSAQNGLFEPRIRSSSSSSFGSISNDVLYAVHQQSTDRVLILPDLEPLYALALQPLACELLTVANMLTFKSLDRTAILYAACIGDTSRYAGANIVERSLSSMLLHSIKGSSACIGGRANAKGTQLWNVGVQISLPSRKVVFILCAREASYVSKELTLIVTNVRVSGFSICDSDWWFDCNTNTLTVMLPCQADSQEIELSTRITISLCI